MTQTHNEFDDHFITTNQDYGSFYCGRLQYSRTNPDNIALELSINDQVRNERRQLKSIAYDILFDPEILADALAENMIAITVPHEYLGMPFINPNQSYPGTETDCSKTSGLQHLLEHFQNAKKNVRDGKQHFDSKAISSQPMHGVKYIYSPFRQF
ncbi:unnamed protein product [Rotaria magnacalcarata]|uniref:Uncharacterized protein n=1 Tax=Rotaria magnacalcarata TaxID=392030 RepID=A0A816PWE4_9BILA|nr:unnamed protein product [Rotaria magnacalcarata]CAF2012181.1 unnamed protein product [Rotaria magnacalcarata]CAF2053218.1 unnamed protein product [Rotaria magnacalcarata]CAF2053225.1 unnamed protein product [Rotaria magnacalcarata]